MIGTAMDQFSPQMSLTQGMIVTLLYHVAGNPDVSGLENPFNDVPADTWYTDAVIWAYHNGIILGDGYGNYCPDDNTTRENLATILSRYLIFTGKTLPDLREYPGFLDAADISDYANEAIEQFFMAGIINGYPGNIFNPKNNVTRAEAASLLMNFLEAICD